MATINTLGKWLLGDTTSGTTLSDQELSSYTNLGSQRLYPGSITTTSNTIGINPDWNQLGAQALPLPEPGTYEYIVELMRRNIPELNRSLFNQELSKYFCNQVGHTIEEGKCKVCKEKASKIVAEELK
jgi:hypothetical protein